MINKKLLSFDRGALRYVGANVAFQWLGMLCNVIFVRAIAQLVGAAFAGSLTSAQLWQNLVLCLATVPMRFAFTMLASAMSDQASKDVKRTLRSSIYAKLARLGPNYTETAATSEVVMLASEGVEQIDTYFAKYLPQLFYSLLAPVTLFVLLVGVHARSAIILLCCVPLIPMSIVAVQKFAKKLLANYWGEYTTLGDSFLENIQGLTTLKIYQADGWKHEQMNAQAERFRRITMKVLTMQLNSVTLMDLMAYGGAGLGIISAVAAFAAGRLTLTATLTIVLLAADFFLPLRLLGSYFHIAMNGAASAEKIFKLLAAEEPADGDRVPGENTTLKLEHVTFGYEKDRTILNDVSFTIPQGSFVSLVGESGCGKSTIAALLSGSRTGYTGSVTLGGVPVQELQQEQRLRTLTLVPHNAAIFKGTVESNLRMAKPDADEAQLWAALEQVNLADFCRSQNGLHDSFLFDKEELGELFDSGISYMELKKLCLHAYAAKKPVKEVAQLRDKYVWTRVDYLLGLTPEKLARAEHEYKVDRIHRLFGLDKKLVDKYMRMGYASHQVKRAMFLARHCDKSVEELLAMKTRQQKWGDICEQLGLPRDACMK